MLGVVLNCSRASDYLAPASHHHITGIVNKSVKGGGGATHVQRNTNAIFQDGVYQVARRCSLSKLVAPAGRRVPPAASRARERCRNQLALVC